MEQGSAAGGCDMGKQNNLTLPETNGLPLKNDGWKMIFFDFLLGWPIFWGYESMMLVTGKVYIEGPYYVIGWYGYKGIQETT